MRNSLSTLPALLMEFIDKSHTIQKIAIFLLTLWLGFSFHIAPAVAKINTASGHGRK